MITLDHPVLECQYSVMSTSVGGAQGECRTRVFSLPDRLGQLTIIELVIYLRRTVFLDRVRSWAVLFRLLARRVSSYHCKTESTTTTRPYSAWTTLGTSWSWRRRSRTRVGKIRIAQEVANHERALVSNICSGGPEAGLLSGCQQKTSSTRVDLG
jgi:hypothetical protein